MTEKQAIIDLGSNTTRMLIVEVLDSGAYRLVEESKENIRLAENLMPDGIIKPAAINRAVKAVKIFKNICEYQNVDRIIAMATAAVRESNNQSYVLDMIKAETGIEFKVLSRQEESYMGYLGVINTIDIKNGIILDLGGGSMEITAIRDRRPVEFTSLPFGALTLTERFLDINKPSDSQFNDLSSFLMNNFRHVPWLNSYTGYELVGVGGTVRTIAKIHQRAIDYPFDDLHNYVISPQEISVIFTRLKKTGLNERMDVPGLSRDRADIIMGGICAINTLIRYLKVSSVRVSSHGLRDGIFFNHFLKEPVVNDVTEFSVDNLSKLYGLDRAHSQRVYGLSKSVFENLKPVHDLPESCLKILWAASMLHASGYYYDFQNRFNNTFYNIRNSRIFGFSHMDTYKTALVAAYYGAGGVKNRSAVLDMILNKDENKALKKLGVILALSDSLDRSKRGRVTGVNFETSRNKVTMEPIFSGDISVELDTASNVIPYFKKAFECELIIKGCNNSP
ncbi:hypothetical protein CUJ83_01210 [Methanocella sp. CWC-04]|uniref:Exopolyphosphatase n=1 Tax=Methanooceanicella nereidis TaxID=2052831 RepID=A0AAP2RB23_9EURY|nr:Ppx/GppA phosphatase family protein [Methanocella sp. CWC-04]MCD1293616.1 hypothetical protein [Methanocella sp. CWC-04]